MRYMISKTDVDGATLAVDKAIFVIDKETLVVDKAIFVIDKETLPVDKTTFIIGKAIFVPTSPNIAVHN
ncbi:unnamed protein product [Toxocara canis]|uniref:Amidohydro-rel domain-containing protein n=1 Tax=Toxocara canis TaxID=6265 RepID=A0A183UAX4_TOXCA|nr:unnamed protein product [Toxocara canis]